MAHQPSTLGQDPPEERRGSFERNNERDEVVMEPSSNKRSRDDGNERGYPNTFGNNSSSSARRRDGNKSSSRDYYGRGDSGYYGRGYREDDYYGGRRGASEDRWKCLECRTWNCPEEERCSRCGTRVRDRDEYRPLKSHRRSDSCGHHGDDRRGGDERSDFGKALDEFGRAVDEFGRDAKKPTKKEKKETAAEPCKWPPCFQEDGAAYVFDARSGFFYEAASDFFFDPKTKLYYGNKKRLYYQYVAGEDPPFQELPAQQVPPAEGAIEGGDEGNKQSAVAGSTSAADGKSNEKKIAISLKTKILPGGNDGRIKTGKGSAKPSKGTDATKLKAAASVSAAQSRVQKKHAAHMELWSERGKEMRSEETPTSPGGVGPRPTQTGTPKVSKESSDTVAKTNKGQPICRLCKRKFANLDKLRQHEKVSALHKENLAKKAAADAKAKQSAMAYRDRAQERRVMYGPESGFTPEAQSAVLEEPHQPTEIVRPEQNLGESNIGNQMLQKLGWKSGGSLGRKQDALQSQEGAAAPSKGRGSLERTIKKDWERIESMAGNARGPGTNKGGIGGRLGS